MIWHLIGVNSWCKLKLSFEVFLASASFFLLRENERRKHMRGEYIGAYINKHNKRARLSEKETHEPFRRFKMNFLRNGWHVTLIMTQQMLKFNTLGESFGFAAKHKKFYCTNTACWCQTFLSALFEFIISVVVVWFDFLIKKSFTRTNRLITLSMESKKQQTKALLILSRISTKYGWAFWLSKQLKSNASSSRPPLECVHS